jgi:GNAT superfamily N-acetyltransferase
MEIKILKKEEIKLLREIDRREIIEEVYYYDNGNLRLEKEFYDVNEFPCSEFEDLIIRLEDDFGNGGVVVGAFDKNKIIGMTALKSKLVGATKDSALMDILYVSKDYRGHGVGRKLMEFIKIEAKKRGNPKLYISATPNKNTVDFYMNQGCYLATKVDKELFKKEPLDIHLELNLQ